MNFDPDHPKWQCCCCRISTALTLLAGIEVISSLVALAFGISSLHQQISGGSGVVAEQSLPFDLSLIALMGFVAVSSTLLIVGIQRRRANMMYPTLAARVLFVIFVAVFGVSTIVQPGEHVGAQVPSLQSKKRNGGMHAELPTGLRLAFLVLLMIVVSLGTFYIIYWIVRCIRFVESTKRLDERRESLIAAGQIGGVKSSMSHLNYWTYSTNTPRLDPELMASVSRGFHANNLQ